MAALGQPPSHPVIGAKSGDEDITRSGDPLAGGAVDQHRFDWRAGAPVGEPHRGTFRGEVPVAPGEQGEQHRAEVPAALGQHVFVARRMLAVAAALQETGGDEGIEPPSQYAGSDAEALLEFIETPQAIECIAQDQDRPPLADAFEAAGDPAFHNAEAFALHGAPRGDWTGRASVTDRGGSDRPS